MAAHAPLVNNSINITLLSPSLMSVLPDSVQNMCSAVHSSVGHYEDLSGQAPTLPLFEDPSQWVQQLSPSKGGLNLQI